MSDRLTPPSNQDGPFGIDGGASNTGTQQRSGTILDAATAVRIGRETFSSSTSWLNSSRRTKWADSLRAFQSLHPSGSKYLSGDYRYRSTLFRPKTRSMVRRDEASTAAAFFSNDDVVNIAPTDDDDPRQKATAEILKSLMQYRLTDAEPPDRIPWFMTLCGARQDAEVMGICVSKVGWEYEERFVETRQRPSLDGMTMEDYDVYKKTKDRPYINLLAPENFRFEPGCDWRDPVRSSPYLIELDPVYMSEARERMESQHGAPPEWLRVSESALRGAGDRSDDMTRRAREQGRVPGQDDDIAKPRDFDICWTRINTVRWGGQDWVYRTISGTGEIVEPPRPIEEVHLHGQRPYTVGCVVLETHKTYPSSKVELTQDLQRAANQDWNSRFDAVMLSLQPRQFVREGSGQDFNDLRRFMPGGVVAVNAAKGEPLTNTITWDRPPPIDGAAFQEQDRINVDWDDLSGAPNAVTQASQIQQQSATGMALMSGEASGLNEYELRLFAETFVEPTLRLLVQVLQAYETDPVVLGLAGKKAGLFDRFGINAITDELLTLGVTTKVNVGIGATNPSLKLKNFATGADIIGKIFGPTAAMGANFQEVTKEVFSLLGYKDGERFFQQGFDPRVAMLQQQLQKAQGKAGPQGAPPDPSRLQAVQIQAQSKVQERQIQSDTDLKIAQLELQREMLEQEFETKRQVMADHREMLIAQHQAAQPVPLKGPNHA